MGWKQIVRSWEAEQRRSQRRQAREHRALLQDKASADRASAKTAAAWDREQKKAQARDEIQAYTNFIECLVSLHVDCSPDMEWHKIARIPAPPLPEAVATHEQLARTNRDAYKPSLIEKLTGSRKKIEAGLDAELSKAVALDRAENTRRQQTYVDAIKSWETLTGLAPGVLKWELSACRKAAAYLDIFDELEEFEIDVRLESVSREATHVTVILRNNDIVPRMEYKLAAGGKVNEKEMAASKYWQLFQDFVCSTALRVGRETLSFLGSDRVIVNVNNTILDTAKGKPANVTILGISFNKAQLQPLDLERIDPSDSMKNFHHRMKFKKASGFEPIPPIGEDEQWVEA